MPVGPGGGNVAAGMRQLLARRSEELDGGAQPIGWKVGINVRSLQHYFGISGPVVGYLTDATQFEVGVPVDVAGWTRPALEVEVAVRVGDDGRVAALAPALELVDLDAGFNHLERILAGNIFHRGVIFGPEVTGVAVGDLAVEVRQGDELVASGELGEEPDVTVEVVRDFLELHGAELGPGDRILAGSMITAHPVEPGEHFEISFGPLGALTVEFC
jgi:2-keto-4-pentenoate hydratase